MSQMLPPGWQVDVRTVGDRIALCVTGPGCGFAHHPSSDLQADVLSDLKEALAKQWEVPHGGS